MKYYKYIRLIFVFIPVVALGSFAYRYINPSGELIIGYDFCREETPYVSGLSPSGRVLDLDMADCIQQMVIDPVYFDVRLSQSYRNVEIRLDLEKNEKQTLNLGIGIDPDNWQWDFGSQKLEMRNEKLGPSTSSGNNVYLIDLSQAQFENNRYRFIISSPGLAESGEEVVFNNMKLVFTKPALTGENMLERLKSLLDFPF